MKRILILFLTSVILFGCSARKVNKSSVETHIDTKITTLDTSNTKTTTSIVDSTLTTEFQIEPIDNTKPIFINDIEYRNVRFKGLKKQNHILTSTDKNESKYGTTNSQIKGVQVVEDKVIERESLFNIKWWVWLLLFGIVLLYLEYRRK